MKRCSRCMQSYTGETCPHCSAPLKTVKEGLTGNPVLSSRYVIGAPLAQSRQAICYAALDNTTRMPVLVEEFFPRGAVTREGFSVVPKGEYVASFKQALAVEPSGRELQCLDTASTNGTVYRVYQPKEGENLTTQAEVLLDTPVLFRNNEGMPVFSINLLTIPPLPKARKAMGSRKAHQKRSLLMSAMLLLLAVVVIAAGAIAMLQGENDPLQQPAGSIEPAVTAEPSTVPVIAASAAPTGVPTAEATATATTLPTAAPTTTATATATATTLPMAAPTTTATATATATTFSTINEQIKIIRINDKGNQIGQNLVRFIEYTDDVQIFDILEYFPEYIPAGYNLSEDQQYIMLEWQDDEEKGKKLKKSEFTRQFTPEQFEIMLFFTYNDVERGDPYTVKVNYEEAFQIPAERVPKGYYVAADGLNIVWNNEKIGKTEYEVPVLPEEFEIDIVFECEGVKIKTKQAKVLFDSDYHYLPDDCPGHLIEKENLRIEWDYDKGELKQREYIVECEAVMNRITVEFMCEDETEPLGSVEVEVPTGKQYTIDENLVPDGHVLADGQEIVNVRWKTNGELTKDVYTVVCEREPLELDVQFVRVDTGKRIEDANTSVFVTYDQESVMVMLPFGYNAADKEQSGREVECEISWNTIELSKTLIVYCLPWQAELNIQFENGEDAPERHSIDVPYDVPSGAEYQEITISMDMLGERAFIGWLVREEDRVKQVRWNADGTLVDDTCNVICERKQEEITIRYILGDEEIGVYTRTVTYGDETLNIPGSTLNVKGYSTKDQDITLHWNDEGALAKDCWEIACEPWSDEVIIRFIDTKTFLPIKNKWFTVSYDPEVDVLKAVDYADQAPECYTPSLKEELKLEWFNGELKYIRLDIPCSIWEARIEIIFEGVQEKLPKNLYKTIICDKLTGSGTINVGQILAEQSFTKNYVLRNAAMETVTFKFLADGQVVLEGQDEPLKLGESGAYELRVEVYAQEVVDVELLVSYADGNEPVPVQIPVMIGAEEASAYIREAALTELKGLAIPNGLVFDWENGAPLEFKCELDGNYVRWMKDEQGIALRIIQMKLAELGYYSEPAEGTYDDAMAQAIHLFTLVNMQEASKQTEGAEKIGLSELTADVQKMIFSEDAKQVTIITSSELQIGQSLSEWMSEISSDAVVTPLAGDGTGKYEPRWSGSAKLDYYSIEAGGRSVWFLAATADGIMDELKLQRTAYYKYLQAEPWRECWVLVEDQGENYIVHLIHDSAIHMNDLEPENPGDKEMLEKVTGYLHTIYENELGINNKNPENLDYIQNDGVWTIEEGALLARWLCDNIDGAAKCDCLYKEQYDMLQAIAEENSSSILD